MYPLFLKIKIWSQDILRFGENAWAISFGQLTSKHLEFNFEVCWILLICDVLLEDHTPLTQHPITNVTRSLHPGDFVFILKLELWEFKWFWFDLPNVLVLRSIGFVNELNELLHEWLWDKKNSFSEIYMKAATSL